MKKTKLFGWAFAAYMMGASFSACTNEADEVLAQESEIKLTSEITPSRAASDLQSTQIEEGQKIGVTITGAKSDHNNVAWIVETDGFLSNTSRPIYYGDDKVTITAYHPFNPSWISDNQTFSVWTNQAIDDFYLKSDLLWATATSPKTKDAIPLFFSHKLSKINVTLVKEDDDENLNNAIISICNTKISATFNRSTGEISGATGEPTEIRAAEISNDVYTASAIIIPQEVSGKFIKITHEDKTYYYTLASAQTLKSGHSYSYTLTVKGKQLINLSSKIDEWDVEENIEGEATEEDGLEIVPTTQIWYTTIDGETFTPNGTWNSKLVSNTYENGKGILTFNEDVTTIDKDVTTSQMTTITLPNTVTTIEKYTFSECQNLNNITIPKNVNNIGDDAFRGCKGLTSIIVDKENAKYDSRNNCNAIIETATNTLISGCANTVIPNTVTAIGNAALQYYPLTTFTIPNSVTSIGVFAFYGSAFTSITIPKDVNTIRINPFAYCPLASIIVDEENTKYDSRNNCNAIIETATNTLISGCANTVIPNTVTTIGMLAFGGCNSLTEITIPNSVTNIGYDAFSYCPNLKVIKVLATIPPIMENTFDGCNDEMVVYVPAESVSAYKDANYWKSLKIQAIGE